jgi:hypothetical protein
MSTIAAAKQQSKEIKQRMQAIRSDLPISMDEAREDVSNLTDWKFYVRSYPHVILPIVAATAFSMVPHTKKPAAASVAFLDSNEGVRRVRFVEDTVPKKSIVAGVVSSLLTMALRSGSSMAVRHLSSMIHGPIPNSDKF